MNITNKQKDLMPFLKWITLEYFPILCLFSMNRAIFFFFFAQFFLKIILQIALQWDMSGPSVSYPQHPNHYPNILTIKWTREEFHL